MENVVDTFWEKYKVEIILVMFSVLTAVFAFVIFFKNQTEFEKSKISVDKLVENKINPSSKILVEIAGAVLYPAVYEATSGARLSDLIQKAGGLSKQADKNFFTRNFNLARLVNDQEKFYIPTIEEIKQGLFNESNQQLDYNKPQSSQTLSASTVLKTANKINLNTASIEELDTLPGIGKVTAEKIIRGRPYVAVEDLKTNKIVTNSVYEKIKELITTN